MFFSWHNPKEKDESEVRVCTALTARGGQLFTQEKEWIGTSRNTNFKASF